MYSPRIEQAIKNHFDSFTAPQILEDVRNHQEKCVLLLLSDNCKVAPIEEINNSFCNTVLIS